VRRVTRGTPGERLRALRREVGLSLRNVHTMSVKLGRKHRDDRFVLPPSRLCDIETKTIVPGMHRLYTLAHVYKQDVRELMGWYGIPHR
jgi:transcriptional regulator with XRE-family HTH domain